MTDKNNSDDIFDEEISTRVVAKQVELVYDNQPIALFSTVVVVAALLLIFFSTSENGPILYGFLFVFSLVLSFRAYINWRYFLSRKNNDIDVGKAQSYYLFGILLTGITWALMTVSIFSLLELGDQILLVIAVLGIVAAAHTTMGFVRLATVMHSVLLVFPLMYAIYFSDFPDKTAMLIAILVYFLFVLRSSILFYNSTLNMLRFNEIAVIREQELELQTADANTANKEKSAFLSRMSHELRTPLNAVLGMNELLLHDKKEPLSEKQSARAKKVDEAGKHLLSIVDDVLDLSRIEVGNVDIKAALMSCQAVINESIKLVENKAAGRNLTINTHFPDIVIHAMADAKRIKQVLVNLLDNAIKYNKHGGIITVILKVESNNVARISVIDTGYGIPEYSLDDLFRPFSRLGADELGIDGTGIGLSLCKQLIELMQGRIGVESSYGKGCCFWVELPYVEQADDVETYACKEVAEVYPNNIKHKKILLVEDNLVNCEVAMDMLEEMGFEADVVNNGQQALDFFDNHQHALILMDCEMPVLDGFAATREIRKYEEQLQQTRTPIIALTAHAITGAKDKCLESGMDDFLSKPFSMTSLQLMLNRWLQEKAKDDQAVAQGSLNEQDTAPLTDQSDNKDVDFLDEDIINRLSSRRKKDGSKLLDNIINLYFEQTSKLLDELTVATQQSDTEAIRSISHALKSSSTNVGATGLSMLCNNLESISEQGKLDNELIEQVHHGYLSVKSALTERLLTASK
ncbi:MAG TPA: response regulator [Gammaproteobacteria bacterium]|nr:response regulator [Gammaproteobacteria bacterium]